MQVVQLALHGSRNLVGTQRDANVSVSYRSSSHFLGLSFWRFSAAGADAPSLGPALEDGSGIFPFKSCTLEATAPKTNQIITARGH